MGSDQIRFDFESFTGSAQPSKLNCNENLPQNHDAVGAAGEEPVGTDAKTALKQFSQ